MTARHWIRVLLAVLVYGTAISIGGALFVSDPTDPILVVPVGGGLAVIAHAVRTAQLDEVGYAVGGMWATILVVSVGVGVVEMVALSGRSLASDSVDVLGAVVVTTVLIVGYVVALKRA